ncbi:MAG TPA: hypothetical protein VLF62_00340 [Candidatus Saccharimonadales bacterium]|nr:hypothetical protein [Candidatus Saccharimonadales bacterium]
MTERFATHPFKEDYDTKHLVVDREAENGPAVIVSSINVDSVRKGNGTQFGFPAYGITGFTRPPRPDEGPQQWLNATHAKSNLTTRTQPAKGELVTNLDVVVEPPLEGPQHIESAARIIGGHFLALEADPTTPNTIAQDLAAANVPFDQVRVEQTTIRH